MAGLSAAHELAERGFDVTVYEQRDAPGGKARSIPYAGSGTGGRADLPGRARLPLLPGLLPSPAGHDGADPARRPRRSRDHLVGATRILFAQAGGPNEIIAPAHLPESAEDFAVLARFLREAATQVGVPPHEYALLVERLLTLLTSCDERRERAVGPAELVGLHGRRAAQRRVPALPRRRAHAHARGRARARDERPHRRR